MKKILLLCALSTLTFAQNLHFEKNKKCSECHPAIYEEYKGSQHAKATIFEDKIHGAVYDKHPQHWKMEKYRCGACHTPTADNLDALLAPNNGVIPDNNNETQNEAVACAYCHRIEDTVSGKAFNENIVSKEERVYFTKKENPGESSFHELKTNKEVFENAKMCMGCHTHKSNAKQFQVCSTDINQNAPKKNCIECHMHKVDGAPSKFSKETQHTFHGFPGLHGDLTNLAQYIGMQITNTDDKKMFTVTINHDAPHASVLHPLRMGKLEVTVTRDGKVTKMQTRELEKIIGTNEGGSAKPTPPWLATTVIKDTRIPANTSIAYPYAWELKTGDIITATFGYLLVKPGSLEKLELQDNKEATKFRVIKEQSFTVQ